MEESEKRRERLMAMRNEAAKGVDKVVDSANTSIGVGLVNPLLETPSETPKESSSRFDFYTDPMAAYSTKRNSNNNAYPRATHSDMTYPNPASRSPQEMMIQSPQVQYNQSTLPNPPRWGGSGAAINYNYQQNYDSYGRGHTHPDMTYPNSASRSPQERMIQSPPVQYNQNPQGNPPRWGGTGAAVNYNYQQNYNSYGRGRGNRYNGPQYDSGRGRGRWQGSSRGSGSVAAEGHPHRYYKKEMVEDPWKMLHAVLWKGLDTLDSDKFRPSKYVQAKKAKVYSGHSDRSMTSQTQPSLAEYLASTVNESATEALAHEPRT